MDIAWEKGCPKQKVIESLYNDLKKLTEYMTKEQAIIHASKILPVFYSEADPEVISYAITACANEEIWKVIKMLEQLIEFETSVINILKNK